MKLIQTLSGPAIEVDDMVLVLSSIDYIGSPILWSTYPSYKSYHLGFHIKGYDKKIVFVRNGSLYEDGKKELEELQKIKDFIISHWEISNP